MREVNEHKSGDLTLGAPIREQKPAAPDPIKPFEIGSWVPEGLVITDKPAPVVHVDDDDCND